MFRTYFKFKSFSLKNKIVPDFYKLSGKKKEKYGPNSPATGSGIGSEAQPVPGNFSVRQRDSGVWERDPIPGHTQGNQG